MKALTLNDFRSVIGTNNYGEVRLSNEGGLEKINTHFLQRWGIGRTKPDRTENILIRQMFADAIQKSGIPQETISRLLGRLGIGKDLTATSDLAGQVLKRADIKSIIADLDAAKIMQSAASLLELAHHPVGGGGSHVDTDLSIAFLNGGLDWLSTKINAYNANQQAAGDKINLNSAEVKILFSRHRAQIMELLSTAKDEGDAMTKLKAFITGKNIKEGVSKFSGTVSAERGNAVRRTLNDNQGALNEFAKGIYQGLRVREDHPLRLFTPDQFIRLQLKKDDFEVFQIYDAKKVAEKFDSMKMRYSAFCEKYKTEIALLTDDEKKCIFYAQANGENFDRNPIKVSFGKAKADFVALPEVAKSKKCKNADLCREAIVKFLLDVKKNHPNMPFEQFHGVSQVFNQTYYNPAALFGLRSFNSKSSDLKIDIKYDENSGRVTVTNTSKNDKNHLDEIVNGPAFLQKYAAYKDAFLNQTPQKFKSVLEINSDGTAQYQFVGADTSV